MRPVRRTAGAALVAVALSAAPPARADDGADLRADAWRAGGTAVGALVLQSVLLVTWKPDHCKFCSPNQLDENVRDALRWTHPRDAQRASDALASVTIPILAAGDAIRSTTSWENAGRDMLVVAEAASLCSLTTVVAKNSFARLRPGSSPAPGQASGLYQSFWSGHTSFAFSIAVSQAMQDTIRGDPAAPWIWAVGLTLATAVGYFRIAGDEHWLTDVVVGAAVGGAFGVGVPLLEMRLVHGVTLSPAPGGIALHF
ncbi:MAG TPA: phosphatase PAP2 family protein [Anaeromyxobacter sp.]|nr:phosphatase PAP2 family protein [Anaeromyxobacter sp.]